MICTLTARRLNPGAYAKFRTAWDATYATHDELGRWSHIYHARDLTDPAVIVSLGFFDGTADELRAAQALMSGNTSDLITTHVAATLLDGSYEVVDELAPHSGVA